MKGDYDAIIRLKHTFGIGKSCLDTPGLNKPVL
jgi:hypothetical protein